MSPPWMWLMSPTATRPYDGVTACDARVSELIAAAVPQLSVLPDSVP